MAFAVRACAALILVFAACAAYCQGVPIRRLAQVVDLTNVATPETEDAAATPECCARLEALGWKGTLPVVVIQATEDLPLDTTTEVDLCTCPNGADFNATSSRAKVGARGNSSKKAAKKSWKVKTIYPNGTSEDVKFLGMPKNDDWVLYGGDESDLTLGMRNWLAYYLARATGEYATRTVWAELFVNTEGKPFTLDDYRGLYIGEEKIKRGKKRVDIAKWTPENPSGGYLFAYENDNIKPDDVTAGPIPGLDEPMVMEYPKNNSDANAWLVKYLTDFHTALFGADWLDNKTGYLPYVDLSSWINYFLVVEASKNPDGYRGSTYMHKDVDTPLAMGPAWDYNEAFGICCGFPVEGYDDNGISEPGVAGGSAISPNGWRFLICADQERCVFDPVDGISSWFRRVWNDTEFRAAADTRFKQLRAAGWSDAAVEKVIDTAAAEIEPAILRDFGKWNETQLKPWYANGQVQFETEVASLQTWVLQRLAWMGAALDRAGTAAYEYPADNQIPVPATATAVTPATVTPAGK